MIDVTGTVYIRGVKSWMKKDGPNSDIVLSSRMRLARNMEEYKFPLLATMEESYAVTKHVGDALTKNLMK